MNWIPLTAPEQLQSIVERSQRVPCLIFKHSTRCSISAMAKYRLEDDWNFAPDELEAYYLDLLAYRPISALIAETFQVHHESPQALLIAQGECIHDASHLDITVTELREVLPQPPAHAGTPQ
jgi:bacillithiol system protein YtxJ